MTNAEMLDNLMGRLGSRTAASLRASVLLELNEKIRQFEQGAELPWFLEARWDENTPTTPAIMVAGQDYLALPDDFLRLPDEEFEELEIQEYPATTWKTLVRVDYPILRKASRDVVNSIPKGFALYGDRIYFGPVPDVGYIFRTLYNKRTSPVVDNAQAITNPWLLNFYNFITLETLNIVGRTHTRDQQFIASIVDELAIARDLFWRTVEARKHGGRQYLLTEEEN